MKRLCVFCGSSPGKDKKYSEYAKMLGEKLAQYNLGLVYGGASIGVMGAIADSILENDGEAWGVIPKSLLDWEVGHEGLTSLEVVDNMHLRKERMYQLSDGFVAMPGGMGTLDEICEIITWSQLKYHNKPCYILNVEGFFDHLIHHFDFLVSEGFLSAEHRKLVIVKNSIGELLDDFLIRIESEKSI